MFGHLHILLNIKRDYFEGVFNSGVWLFQWLFLSLDKSTKLGLNWVLFFKVFIILQLCKYFRERNRCWKIFTCSNYFGSQSPWNHISFNTGTDSLFIMLDLWSIWVEEGVSHFLRLNYRERLLNMYNMMEEHTRKCLFIMKVSEQMEQCNYSSLTYFNLNTLFYLILCSSKLIFLWYVGRNMYMVEGSVGYRNVVQNYY